MRITSHAPWMFAGMTAAGVLTLALMGTYIYLMRQSGRDVWYLYVVMAPFLLVGSLLAYFGGRTVVRLARYGTWELEVPDGGGVFGQPLEVTLFPGQERVPNGPLTCHLRCISISRDRARSNVKPLWDTTWTTSTAVIHPRSGVRLRLPLPDRGQPTNVDGRTGVGVQWQLNVVIPSERMSEEAVFDLPVRL